jgi:subtilisin family serine protease
LFLVGCSFYAKAQLNRYFVFFKDKANSSYTINNPSVFLSAKSIARRQKQGVSITDEDLPVNQNYVQQVKAAGAKTFFTSKWWNGVLVQTDAATIATINSFDFVVKSELVAPGERLIGGRVAQKGNVATQNSNAVNATEFQLSQLQLDKMHASGFRGEGVDIAQFDSGWKGANVGMPFQDLFAEGRIKDTYNFVSNTRNVFTESDHGTHVLSVMAASVPNTFTGGIYKANYHLFLTEDVSTEYRIEEYNWAFAAEKADSAGVDVINSSLGYNTFDLSTMNYDYQDMNGSSTVVSISARKAVDKGIIVVCSAGNEGANSWKYITAPADADGVLATGATTSLGNRSNFSSFGPSADKRIKPEVVALGSGVSIVTAGGSLSTASGTSLASPLVASLAAGLVQANPHVSPTKIVEAIKKSGSQNEKPDSLKGFGIPSFVLAHQLLRAAEQEAAIEILPTWVVDDTVAISFKDLVSNITIQIFDLQGKLVSDHEASVNSQNPVILFDISGLGQGIYIVRVVTPQASISKRILKAK